MKDRKKERIILFRCRENEGGKIPRMDLAVEKLGLVEIENDSY